MTFSTYSQDQLTALVRTVPGVTAIYSPHPVIARTAKVVLSAVIDSPATAEHLHVTDSPVGVAVRVVIGVSRERAAGDVCRSVYDEIAGNITATGQIIDKITVKVGRIS